MTTTAKNTTTPTTVLRKKATPVPVDRAAVLAAIDEQTRQGLASIAEATGWFVGDLFAGSIAAVEHAETCFPVDANRFFKPGTNAPRPNDAPCWAEINFRGVPGRVRAAAKAAIALVDATATPAATPVFENAEKPGGYQTGGESPDGALAVAWLATISVSHPRAVAACKVLGVAAKSRQQTINAIIRWARAHADTGGAGAEYGALVLDLIDTIKACPSEKLIADVSKRGRAVTNTARSLARIKHGDRKAVLDGTGSRDARNALKSAPKAPKGRRAM